MVKKLRTFGFDPPRYKNGHPFMARGKFKLKIPNNHHETISEDTVSKVLKRAGISDDEWKRA
jgi:predicted RNA binding protein YcfA (HicA-like mRNA interferase family)